MILELMKVDSSEVYHLLANAMVMGYVAKERKSCYNYRDSEIKKCPKNLNKNQRILLHKLRK